MQATQWAASQRLLQLRGSHHSDPSILQRRHQRMLLRQIILLQPLIRCCLAECRRLATPYQAESTPAVTHRHSPPTSLGGCDQTSSSSTWQRAQLVAQWVRYLPK